MSNTTINVQTLKRLTDSNPNVVKHFCRTSARLHGLLALREQLNISERTGIYQTFAMVEADAEEIRKKIAKDTVLCAHILVNLNSYAAKRQFPAVCYSISEMSMSQVIKAVNDYVDELISQSDYEMWVNECGRA